MFFALPEGGKSIKNRSKIVAKGILNEEAKTASKNIPRSVQHDPQAGPSWGYVGLGNALGRVQERRKTDTENHTEKKHTKKRLKKIRRPSVRANPPPLSPPWTPSLLI